MYDDDDQAEALDRLADELEARAAAGDELEDDEPEISPADREWLFT